MIETALTNSTNARTGTAKTQNMLALVQLPPPVHGVTTMSKRMLELGQAMDGVKVHHLWAGGARAMSDVGKKDLRKLAGFGGLLLKLVAKFVTGRRYDIGYVTLAPHGGALMRDAVLILAAKVLTPRLMIHLHTRGLEDILVGKSARDRFVRAAVSGCELIAIESKVAKVANASGRFKAVHHLSNHVVDPGEGAADTSSNESAEVGDETDCKLVCGFLGNLDERKGVLRFVDTIKALSAAGIAVRATIAGGPTSELSIEDVRDYARKQGVADKVEVAGFLGGQDKTDLLRDLDVMIYLSDHDLSPLVLLETMAHGAVPISFDTGGIGELLGPQFAGHVIGDKQDKAAYLKQVVAICKGYVQSPATLVADKRRARARYLAHYTPDKFVANVTSIIRTGAMPDPGLDHHNQQLEGRGEAPHPQGKAVA